MSELAVYPRVGIVILNWNQPEYTLDCLESLAKVDYPSYEAVVVDNGSGDGSPDLIKSRFPTVNVVENGRNLGFAAGNNVGIRLLMSRGVEFVLLLNNDTEAAPEFLRLLVEAGRDPGIGVLGPKIFYHSCPEVIWSAGGTVDECGRPCHLRADEFDDQTELEPKDVDYVTGCAILVKRAVIERIGYLDERFFIYFEETEWCARARKAGFRVVYVPQARLWHKIKQAARNTSPRYLYLMTRNRLLYLSCTGADPVTVIRAGTEILRGATSSALSLRSSGIGPQSTAVLRGVFDYMLGRFGPPPACL